MYETFIEAERSSVNVRIEFVKNLHAVIFLVYFH